MSNGDSYQGKYTYLSNISNICILGGLGAKRWPQNVKKYQQMSFFNVLMDYLQLNYVSWCIKVSQMESLAKLNTYIYQILKMYIVSRVV